MVESRSRWSLMSGPLQSDEDKRNLFILVAIVASLCWPFLLSIPNGDKWTLAVAWWVFLILGVLVFGLIVRDRDARSSQVDGHKSPASMDINGLPRARAADPANPRAKVDGFELHVLQGRDDGKGTALLVAPDGSVSALGWKSNRLPAFQCVTPPDPKIKGSLSAFRVQLPLPLTNHEEAESYLRALLPLLDAHLKETSTPREQAQHGEPVRSAPEKRREHATAPSFIADELTKLAQLRDSGVLSGDEFMRLKAGLIQDPTGGTSA